VTDSVRGRVVVTAATAPPRRDAVVDFGDGQVTAVRPATAEDRGPVHDIVIPGLIDAHSHARGVPLAEHGVGDGPLERFLLELRALTPLPPADEALVAGAAALATGITSVQVLYHGFGAGPEYARGVRAVAGGLSAAGVRAFIALGLTDQDEFIPPLPGGAALAGRSPGSGAALAGRFPGPGTADLSPSRGLAPGAFTALAAGLLGRHGLVSIDAVGPVAPQWCSDVALRAIRAVDGAARVHAHLLESDRQRLAPGGDPVARLAGAGLLTAASSFAHGVWLDPAQISRVAAAGAVIVHCPGSNARLAGGTCPVRRLLAAGVPVALGLDSHGAAPQPDAFAEMRFALRAAASAGQPLTAAQVLTLATAGGARALRRPGLGTLRPGAAADLVALRLPGAVTADDPVEHLVAAASPPNVVSTWVGGRDTRAAGPAAGPARARLAAAMTADARARAARVAQAAAAWEAADSRWRQFATTRTAGSRCP
jgi:5-methylthioadenosine/S-adenosylhomocysteine deaminase